MKKLIVGLILVGMVGVCWGAEYEGSLWDENYYRHEYRIDKKELLKIVEAYLATKFDLPDGNRCMTIYGMPWADAPYIKFEIRQPVEVIIKPKTK